MKRAAALVAAAIIVTTAGYATAAGVVKVIRLQSGQSVRIGNVKVIAVGKTRVVRRTVTERTKTVTGPTHTVTGPTQTITTVGATVTSTQTVTVPGPVTTVTSPAQTVTQTVTVTTTPPPPPGPKTSFGDGTYRVAIDIVAGTYRAPGGDSCYWARLEGFSGTLDDIIANGFGQTLPIVTISASDAGFETSRCGPWVQV
jgi:hypothetical protein